MISGRPIAELDRLFSPLRLPAAGEYGAQLRTAPGVELRRARGGPSPADHAAELALVAARFPGVQIEVKAHGVAFHDRAVPEVHGELWQALRQVVADRAAGDWVIAPGKCVFEVKLAVLGKGRALGELAREPPFAGRRPLFVGDDEADEEGFAAARALGGWGIGVGPRRSREADWYLPSPAALRRWLEGWSAKRRTS